MPQMAPSLWLLIALTITLIISFKINNIYFYKKNETDTLKKSFDKKMITWMW